jgi:hypothetical protein
MKKTSQGSCWDGYERVPGTKKFAKGSCKKKSCKEWSEWLAEREQSVLEHKDDETVYSIHGKHHKKHKHKQHEIAHRTLGGIWYYHGGGVCNDSHGFEQAYQDHCSGGGTGTSGGGPSGGGGGGAGGGSGGVSAGGGNGGGGMGGGAGGGM